jgi:hypothetical protein
MLTITGGDRRTEIPLDHKQLTTAGVAYRPRGNDAGLRLELTGDNTMVSGALRCQEAPGRVVEPTRLPAVTHAPTQPWYDDGL